MTWYFHVQNEKIIEISTSTPSTTEESTTSTTLSTTTIQPNTKPQLCKVNFLPARGPLGLLPTPFKICTKKLLKKVPFQNCGRNNDCGGGVRLIFMRIISISKVWNKINLFRENVQSTVDITPIHTKKFWI